MNTKLTTLVLLFILSIQVFSQGVDTVLLHGKVLNESNTAIKFAHISIKNSTKGTISNIQGEFSLKITAKDEILFSCMGYKSKIVSFPEGLPEVAFKTVYLNKDTITLSEATIRPWPATVRKLKEKIEGMGFEEKYSFNTQDKFLNGEMQTANKLALRNVGEPPVSISGPFSLIYNAIGDKPRQLRQLPRQQAQAKKEEIIKKKFNIDIIKMITKMNNQDSIKQFIDYCNYDESFLVLVDEYDLIIDLQKKFEEFKSNHN